MNYGDIYSYRIDINASTSGADAVVQSISKINSVTNDNVRVLSLSEKTAEIAANKAAAAAEKRAEREKAAAERAAAAAERKAKREADAAERAAARAEKAAQRKAEQEVKAAERAAAAAKKAAAEYGIFGTTIATAGANANRASGAFGNAGATVFQMANLMEDAQFGARALGNNMGMLISTMGGFSPVAMALGGVMQVGVAVFRDQIDAGLEWAGILDSNLIPKTKELTAEQTRWNEGLKSQERMVRDIGKTIDDLYSDLSQRQQTGLIETLVGEGAGMDQINALRTQIVNIETMLARDPVAKITGAFDDQLETLRSNLKEAVAGYDAEVRKVLDDMLRGAATGDDAEIQKLADLARKSGLDQLANDLEKLTTEYGSLAAKAEIAADELAKVTKAAEDEKKAHEDLIQTLIEAGKENEEYTREVVAAADERARAVEEEERRKVEAAKQARLDDRTKLAVQSFGPMISGQIGAMLQQAEASGMGREQANAVAIDQTMQFLMRAGLDTRTAGSTAQALVEEQSGLIQELAWGVDAMVGMMRESLSGTRWNRQVVERTLGNVRRLQIMSQNMNPRRNNRANGL